jgi:superfamily II DNA helicase RecQ
MQIKIFTLPVTDDGKETEALNRFLRGNKILAVEQQLVNSGGSASWCFCVRYLERAGRAHTTNGNGTKKAKVDYKESLEPAVFARFNELRKIRKEVAAAAVVPAYAIFTDAELARVAALPKLTLEAMRGVKGIGQKKIEKYGEGILAAFAKKDAT